MTLRPLVLAALSASSLLLASAPASARECQYWSGNGPGVYNLQNGLTETYAQHVDQAGAGGLRMGFRIDTQTTWDKALFDQYDAYLAVAREHGLDVMAIVLYESTTGGQVDWNSGFDATGMSPYVQTFVDTAKLLMNRYGDQIKYWEIWNEPNAWTNASYATDPTHAGGTYVLPQVYAKMLAETFVQASAAITSKGLHLIAGGLFAHDIGGGFSPAADYAKQVYDLGPWGWMKQNYGRSYPWDGFGYHIYIDQGGPTSGAHILQYVDAIQALKVQYSDSVPLWITEFGWQAPKNMSLAQQASNLDLALTTFESRGDVARTFVFKVDDYDDWGIFDTSWSPKPAVATYQSHDKGCAHLPVPPGSDAGADSGAGADSDSGADAGAGADSGVDAGAGAGADSGADADSSADTPTGSPSGCGCATCGLGAPDHAAAVALTGLIAPLLRRRRPGQRRQGDVRR